MAYTLHNRTLEKVGVVGSGQIGPDIALFFAKTLAPSGVQVVVVDVSEDALAAGQKKAEKKIGRGEESGAFKPALAQAMRDALTFTTDYEQLRGADLVIEAATEDLGIKHKIIGQLEELCADDAILASNSSHMTAETIFAQAKHKERGAVIHYFFPAERNVIVEVVPAGITAPAVADWLMAFYEAIGKVPIHVGSRYGFAIDPVFEGLFQAAALGVEAGWGSVKQVDAMTQRALKQGVGPFTAMNLTGGNPLTAHGLDEYTTEINSWFRTPQILKDAVESGTPWETAGRGETVEYSDEQYEKVSKLMMGAYFGLVGEVLDSGISNVADLEMAIPMALVVKPPFAWMNQIGAAKALELVEGYAATEPNFVVPECIKAHAASGAPFEIPVVLRKDVDGVAVVTIRRPAAMNALNLEVFQQLRAHAEAVAADDNVRGMVITGFGHKAFVAGADIKMLAKLETAADGEANSRQFHDTLDFLEDMQKPVVAAMNGLALGGGNELAMACHARIARKGLKVLAGQPEINLGIIPGAGGTQRLIRLVGLGAAAEMMRTARPISSAQALEAGLISEEVEGDLIPRAIELVKGYADGSLPLERISRDPMTDVPEALPEVDLGHYSRKIDSILCSTILEGARLPLRDGLALESKQFGACVETKDMHIGMENFIKNGPRAQAEFVNE